MLFICIYVFFSFLPVIYFMIEKIINNERFIYKMNQYVNMATCIHVNNIIFSVFGIFANLLIVSTIIFIIISLLKKNFQQVFFLLLALTPYILCYVMTDIYRDFSLDRFIIQRKCENNILALYDRFAAYAKGNVYGNEKAVKTGLAFEREYLTKVQLECPLREENDDEPIYSIEHDYNCGYYCYMNHLLGDENAVFIEEKGFGHYSLKNNSFFKIGISNGRQLIYQNQIDEIIIPISDDEIDDFTEEF